MTVVNVRPAGAETASAEPGLFRSSGPEPEAAASPLAGLKAKLAEVRDELYVDMEVPRWDEPVPDGRDMGLKVFVRYRPLSPSEALRTSEHFQKAGPDREVQANAQLLADCCVGVYALVPGDETKYSLRDGDPTGMWTRMDPDLANMLGPVVKDPNTAVGVCRGLYCTDGDITAAALALADWSAQASEKAEKGFQRP